MSCLPFFSSSASSSYALSKWSGIERFARPVTKISSLMPGLDGLLRGVLDERLVDDRQHLLRIGLRRRQEARAETGHGKHGLAHLRTSLRIPPERQDIRAAASVRRLADELRHGFDQDPADLRLVEHLRRPDELVEQRVHPVTIDRDCVPSSMSLSERVGDRFSSS